MSGNSLLRGGVGLGEEAREVLQPWTVFVLGGVGREFLFAEVGLGGGWMGMVFKLDFLGRRWCSIIPCRGATGVG